MKHKVEIFSADCPICRETVRLVKEADCCKNSEIVIHKCSGNECCQPAKDYKIRSVPSVVVDGKLAIEGRSSLQKIERNLGNVCSR